MDETALAVCPIPAMFPRVHRNTFLAVGLAAVVALVSGCLFIPSHQVAVDAISGPLPESGLTGYQLVDKDPLMVRDPALQKHVFSCVATALETKGATAALAGVRPTFVIEVEYGANRSVGSRGYPGMALLTEHFLQISARRPRVDGGKGRGEEIWNVRTSVREDQVTLAAVMPVLAAVAADYAGLDTLVEKTISIREDAPLVVLVKSVASGK